MDNDKPGKKKLEMINWGGRRKGSRRHNVGIQKPDLQNRVSAAAPIMSG